MKTIDSTAREPEGPVVVPLSVRQSRLSEAAARVASAAGLTGAAVSLPATLIPSACIELLSLLCSRVDSLRARAVSAGENVQWELDQLECPGAVLRVLPPEHADLQMFLNGIEPDPFAPLTVSYVDRADSRLWLLAVGLVRCDLCGLEQLIARWVQALTHSSGAEVEPPDLITVHQGLARASESAEARSARVYWNRHVDNAEGPHPAEEGGGVSRGRFAPCETARLDIGPLLKSLQVGYALSARTLLLATWIMLVNRLAGTSKATLWVQFEGRFAPRLQQFIGRLAHTVPLTLRVPQNVTCHAWIRDVDRAMTMHERLQDSYSPTPATLGAADFQFVFREPLSATGHARIVERVAGAEPFHLQLGADVLDDRCEVVLRFDASIMRAVQAECLARYFEKLLRAFAEPSAVLAAVCASAAPALAPILRAECGPARAEWTTSDQLGRLVSRGLRDCRVLAAGLRGENESFESRVVRRARALLRTCTGERKMLALVAPASFEATVTVAAAVIAGVPVAFVDPRWPVARRQSAIEQVRATLLVGLQASVADLALDGPTLSFEQLAELAASETSSALAPDHSGPDELAYVVFSSGSTGAPKPIVIPRRALQNQLLWLQERMPLAARDVILHRTPLGFDAAVWELLHPICSGATLVIALHETSSDPRTIIEAIVDHSVSVVQLTPHLLRTIHEETDVRTLSSLRLVVVGGDRLPSALARSVLTNAHFALVNAYGPSECCIQVSIADVSVGHLTAEMASASVGQPMPNSGMHILSDDLEPLLDGCIGRLFLSGTPLGYGYAGDARGTARAFLPLPGDHSSGMRMYDTGDLARRVRGTEIEILGRVDKQMKLNGVRVDLLAIEKCLHQVDEVADAAVIAVCDEYGAGYVTAFIATRGQPAEVTRRARKHLEETLLPTSQPAHYICVPRLPLTDRGKIDGEALRESAVAAATPPSVPPRSPLEETIASVWREVLKRDAIGVHDDFFLAGGHSLLFAQVITRLRQALSLEISLRAIFMHPTIALLGEHIEALQRDASPAALNCAPDDAR